MAKRYSAEDALDNKQFYESIKELGELDMLLIKNSVEVLLQRQMIEQASRRKATA